MAVMASPAVPLLPKANVDPLHSKAALQLGTCLSEPMFLSAQRN